MIEKYCITCCAELSKLEIKKLIDTCESCNAKDAEEIKSSFDPKDEGKTWWSVPSPYKDYRRKE